MLVKSIYVQDYSSGKEYVYGDKSGSWQSIKSVGGTVNAGPQLNNGNIGKIEDTPAGSNSGTIADSSQFKAPSNSGLVPSATEKSKATSAPGSSGADLGEPARPTSTSSGSSGSESGSGSNKETSASTTPKGTDDKDLFEGSASGLATLPGLLFAAAGLVAGLVL